MEHLDELYELCETISRELADANEKIRKAGGKLSGADVEYVDKLTHTLKSIKTTIAMMEAEDGYSSEDGGMSNARRGRYSRRGSYDGGSYEGGSSYARGRGRYAKRDSMGRYSSMYYEAADDVTEKLKELMEEAPDEKTKVEIKKFITKLEQM